ncbi:MAG TPA: dihydrolipoamide acetyltransferase family protein [Saprospiraceae bacterium]|nr:dihydrolipoamide acetyltransferase family protein [Saprospiraceae bacterium]
MAKLELIMPKMGESIMEATILKWLKKEGDPVALDETILEIATDKVDSEIPSPAKGIVGKLLFEVNAVVPIGTVIAYIETDAADVVKASPAVSQEKPIQQATPVVTTGSHSEPQVVASSKDDRFYSPLVKNIAKEENLSAQQLAQIAGTGEGGRVTKRDILAYVDQLRSGSVPAVQTVTQTQSTPPTAHPISIQAPAVSVSGNVEIIEMDRMRKLVADHMVMSKHVSPHVTSFVEIDVTPIVLWRDRIKAEFAKKYNQKITFTPIFIEAVCKALRDFPMVNISVAGTKIIVRKDINIGMAAALPSGNLIVPVIKNADRMNLAGLSYLVNDLADRARNNKLKPDEIQDGSFTLTNVGTFGNLMGTPIINQPQVAILATGAIKKKPAVIETPTGDVIGIRHMMFLSLSYDHRVVDGALGGSFLRRVGDYLEQFDINQSI